jgi:heme-degrading monooxygenase HmoA
MHTRIVTTTGAQDIDGGIRYLRDTVTPILRQQKGFRGVTGSADRKGGLFGVLSLWETAADRDASESAIEKARDGAARILGGTMTVELFEEVLAETTGKPRSGVSLLVRRASMDPAKLDGNLEYFRREVLPQIKAGPGFLAVRQLVNRSTGDTMVGSVWADTDAMNAAAEAAEARTSQAAAQGITLGELSRREVVFVEIP